MKIRQIVTRVLLLVYVGLPLLHGEAIGSDSYPLLSTIGISSSTSNRQLDLYSRVSESQGTPDGRPASTTPLIPHCDFEVSPIDQPPPCLFAPPGSVRARNDQRPTSPLSFTIDIASPPPRQT